MVDIIIPVYNSRDTLSRTLASIAYQNTNYDFKVTIIDDSSDEAYDDIIDIYKNLININLLRLDKNMGPGRARQFGLDNTSNPYIVFIDSDDIFSSPDSIDFMVSNIISRDDDVLVTTFLEETRDGFIEKKNDTVWFHGKIYKREFLESNNIRFNGYRVNEDTGFNTLVFMYDLKYDYIDFKTYIWCNNQNSITRKNNYEFAFKGCEWFAKNMLWALEVAMSRNLNPNKIGYNAYMAMCSTYFMYASFHKNYTFKNVLPSVRKIINIYRNYPLSENEKLEIVESYKNVSPFGDNFSNMFFSGISFDDYVKMVEGGYYD